MVTRRGFLGAGTAGMTARAYPGAVDAKPALLGGKPVRTEPFPAWPMYDAGEEEALVSTLKSRKWLRVTGERVGQFEQAYARLMGTKGCLSTANGTAALFLSLKALGIGPGDEVIVPPYTFIATVNAVLLLYALPVFVDSDRETAQIDARKIEGAITDRTRAILPVHLGGSAADLDAIMAVAQRRGLPVVEDACQAHLGEWRGRKLGSYGAAGCFSFQATKNLACGEGGAVVSNDQALLEKCFAIHNHGRGRAIYGYDFTYGTAGANLRMDEFHAALAMVQMTRVERHAQIREQNAKYLSGLLREIPGIQPLRQYPGCTRNAWHLYMFRYEPEAFAGLSKGRFLKALLAEGVIAASGYTPLNKDVFLKNTLTSRPFQSVYSKEQIAAWEERNRCPENDRLCSEAVWIMQFMLLGSRNDMDQIAAAVRKVHAAAAQLVKG